MELKNSIFAKTLRSLYKLNFNKSNEVHSIVIDAIFKALVMVEGDLNRAKLEMAINTATGSWLDYWGDFFNVPRERRELDEKYASRIIQETIEPKVTLNAIKRAAARWLNRKNDTSYSQEDIIVFEPWKYLLKYSQRGLLSGNAKMTDGEYWRYGVIEVSIPDTESISFELMSYLNTIKAAGVQILYSYRPYWGVVNGYDTVNPVFNSRICNKFTSFIQPMVRPHVIGLYLTPSSDFIGVEDSDFSGGLDEPDSPLSGFPNVVLSVGLHRDLPLAWGKIRMYEDSYLTSLQDISKILSKDYEDTTIEEALNLEDLDAPTSESGKYSINTGTLSHSLLPIQITTLSSFRYHKYLILNKRNADSSPIFNSLIESGFLKGFNSKTLLNSNISPQDILRYYSYGTLDDLTVQKTIEFENEYLKLMESKFSLEDDSYKDWVSEMYLKKILNKEYCELPIEELVENTHVINELLKVEPIYYNVLMPTVITTSQV